MKRRALLALPVIALAVWLLLREEAPPAGAPEPAMDLKRPPSDSARQPEQAAPLAAGRLDHSGEAGRMDGERQPAPASLDGGEVSPDAGGAGAEEGKRRVHAWLEANAAAAEKYVDAFCAEARGLKQARAFSEPPRTRDAAVFMDGRADWEGGRVGLLHLPASLTDRMGNPPGAWRSLGPSAYQGLDFGWMRELLQYDHWSLLGAGPLRYREGQTFFEADLPNFVTLLHWVRLRLLKGLHEGDLPRASEEVRHLADLCASSGTLVGEMIRAGMYGIERETWTGAGLTPVEPLPTAEEVQRFRFAGRAAPYFLFPGVRPEVRRKALECMPLRCAALNEAIGAAAALRGVTPSADEAIGWLSGQQPCEPALAAWLAKVPPSSVESLATNLTAEAGVEPFVRQLLDGGL
ncbi:MAG: hypothetical protein AB1938_19930 [Myxococcota bacterium]